MTTGMSGRTRLASWSSSMPVMRGIFRSVMSRSNLPPEVSRATAAGPSAAATTSWCSRARIPASESRIRSWSSTTRMRAMVCASVSASVTGLDFAIRRSRFTP